MDDNDSKSPWDQLAQDLGTQPSSEAFQRSQPPSVEIPSAETPSDQEEASEMPHQLPSDWNALADSLGLDVPVPSQPEPSQPPVDSQTVEETIAELAEEPTEESEQAVEIEASATQQPSTGSESMRDDDSLGFGFVSEEADELLPPLPSEVDQIMSGGDWENEDNEDTVADDHDDEEDNPGLSSDAAKNAFDALFSAGGSALAIPMPDRPRKGPVFKEDLLSEELDDLEQKASDPEQEESDQEQRPKRRRSRRRRGRGRDGRKTETEQTTNEETADDQDALNGEDQNESPLEDISEEDEKPRRRRSRRRPRRSASADDPNRTDDSASYDQDESTPARRGANRERTGHRNMPTWSEALSVIIEGNIELHSKAPSRQSSSRGRGRGGRRRKKT